MHASLRVALICLLGIVGCSDAPGERVEAERAAARPQASAETVEGQTTPQPIELAPTRTNEIELPPASGPPSSAPPSVEQPAAMPNQPSESEPSVTTPKQTPEPIKSEAPDPADPLAPIMPAGPEPGSPEADKELLELLDESTISQDEFDKAFGPGNKPKIDDSGKFELKPTER